MRNCIKSIGLLVACVLLLTVAVGHTIAYLIDVDVSTSTFDVPVSEATEETQPEETTEATKPEETTEATQPEETSEETQPEETVETTSTEEKPAEGEETDPDAGTPEQ